MTQICFSEVDRQVDRRAQASVASVASVHASHGLFIVRHPASNGRPQVSTLPLCIYRQKESKGSKKNKCYSWKSPIEGFWSLQNFTETKAAKPPNWLPHAASTH